MIILTARLLGRFGIIAAVVVVTLFPVSALAEPASAASDAAAPGATVLVQDYADLPAVDREWQQVFPDPANRPARQVMQLGVQRRSRAQFHMLAAV